MDFRRTTKLKYRLANNIFYRILNVSYIFLYNSWIYSECDNFQGCVTIGCLHFLRSYYISYKQNQKFEQNQRYYKYLPRTEKRSERMH